MEQGRSFDPGRYLRKLGSGEYLEVKWRLLWLRTEHPEAVISTELVEHRDGFALFRAQVTIPGSGSATGWGSETSQDFSDYIEKAETKALGRALAALGYGTQFCHDFDMGPDQLGGERVVDSPVEVSEATERQIKAIYSTGRRVAGLSEQQVVDESIRLYGRKPEELNRREASDYISRLSGDRGLRR